MGFLTTKGTKKNKRHKKKWMGVGKRNALVDGFFNHKSHKRKKKENGWSWEAEPQKEQRKTKGTKKSGWVFRIRNALARSATKAPKV